MINDGSYLLKSIEPENILQRELTLKIAKLFSKFHFTYMFMLTEEVEFILNLSLFLIKEADLSSALLNFWEGETLTNQG